MADNSKGLNMVMSMFLIAIIGTILVGVIADEIWFTRNPAQVTNESLDISAARVGIVGNSISINSSTFNVAQENITSIDEVFMDNSTLLVLNTDYNQTGSQIVFQNSSTMVSELSNDTLVTYTYNTSSYVDNSAARVLLGLLTLFFVMGILLLVYSKLRDAGIFEFDR